jgi:hypothetical protein
MEAYYNSVFKNAQHFQGKVRWLEIARPSFAPKCFTKDRFAAAYPSILHPVKCKPCKYPRSSSGDLSKGRLLTGELLVTLELVT